MIRSRNYNKIFGIGLTRTGTTSLNKALNHLGIKSIHYPSDVETFRLLANGICTLPVLKQYDALTDTHAAAFYRQFDEQYPGSKFILTVRDIDDWLVSTRKHFRGIDYSNRMGNNRKLREFNGERAQWLRAAVYGTIVWDHSVFKNKYNIHLASCLDYFKNRDNDFLIMDICNGDGWDMLCPFLGKNIPKSEFPYSHSFKKRHALTKKERRAKRNKI